MCDGKDKVLDWPMCGLMVETNITVCEIQKAIMDLNEKVDLIQSMIRCHAPADSKGHDEQPSIVHDMGDDRENNTKGENLV